MGGRSVRALRGAITVEADSKAAITNAASELLTRLLETNGIGPDDIVSIVFTATPDLTAEFPAAGARSAGLAAVPVLSATEVAVPGALARCVRVLVHFHSERAPAELRPAYLRGARVLRTDLLDPDNP